MNAKLTPVGKVAPILSGKVSVRFRKTTYTWVIYHSGRIIESGFASEKEAKDYLDDWFDVAANESSSVT